MRVLAEIGVGGVDGQRCVTLVFRLVSHTGVYDACMVVRVYLSGLRAPCMPRRCLRRLETRHPYHLGGVFWYGSSISIIIYLSLIRGISSVADGKNGLQATPIILSKSSGRPRPASAA